MHTGTHFIKYGVFKCPNLFRDIPPSHQGDDGEKLIMVAHVVNQHLHLWDGLLEQHPIVAPLRHPAKVLRSFKHRGKKKKSYIEQWNNMIKIIHPHKPLYLHIDEPKIRDKELKKISELADEDLSVNWDEILRGGAETEPTHNLEINEKTLKGVPEKLIDFYHATTNL